MNNEKMAQDSQNIPKVTLHEHIEGTITPKMAEKLAERHNVKLPDGFIMPEGSYDKNEFPYGRYGYDESDFWAFIDTYDKVAGLVKTPQDYYDITKDYLSINAKNGGAYCELIISPEHMAVEDGKLSAPKYKAMMEALSKASADVKKEYGMETRFIATAVRNMGTESVVNVAKFVAENHHPLVTGFGIAGNERAGDFDDFKEAHEVAGKAGLKKSYHAGEICGVESIKKAMAHGAVRIGHGINAVNDEVLMKELAEKGVLLEVAPTSNRILVNELEGDINKHPLRKLYDAGIRLTINPDDGGIFGTDNGKEHKIAGETFGFSKAELIDVALCGIEAGFCDDKTKKSLKEKVLSFSAKEDVKEFKSLSTKASNPYLKSRLALRAKEVEAYQKIASYQKGKKNKPIQINKFNQGR